MVQKVDFSKRQFIKENMWFYTFDDFKQNRKIIKKHFKSLDKNAKLFYMWYVYANINMGENKKNKIWDYLNFDDPQYEILLISNHL